MLGKQGLYDAGGKSGREQVGNKPTGGEGNKIIEQRRRQCAFRAMTFTQKSSACEGTGGADFSLGSRAQF